MQQDSPIAIIGLAYRAPGVGRKGLWDFLAEAKSAWSKVPAERFDQDAFYHPNSSTAGTFSSQGAHFLPDDIYSFDAPFFNLRPDEARAADPQHRLLLECALEATENAGIRLIDLAGANIGVFSAIGTTEYGQQSSEDLSSTTTWTALGNAPCMFANRLSYFFDLNGPSIALDAACASSAYAIHLACQSLRAGECSAAFVGASTLILGPSQWNVLDKLGALSPEGKCHSYDAKASGFGRGEGAACLLLKPLDDAIRSGDPVHAIIRNSACSHSGRSEGITMPRRIVQEEMLLRVHENIGLSPSDTPVVEGHGTGTPAGDPIEAGAFAAVLAKERTSADPLFIGSVKSNLGHLEGASGILAAIKAIMMIQHGCILPNSGFEKLNQWIEGWEKLKVAQETLPWPPNTLKRVLVTNFGFGGSNAAVLIEEAPTTAHPSDKLTNGTNANCAAYTNGNRFVNGSTQTNNDGVLNGNSFAQDLPGQDPSRRLFVFSAKTESSLTSYLSSFKQFLESAPQSSDFSRNLSFTLGQRRTHYPYRVAVAANSPISLSEQLTGRKPSKVKEPTIAFVFTGQGAQHEQIATGLMHYKAFSTAINQAETCLHTLGASWSLIEELNKPAHESRINDAEIGQPACTAIQLALVVLLKSWGIMSNMVTGHSSGEIAAAFAAGIVSFRSAIALAYFRGKAAATLSKEQDQKGAMLALGTSSEAAAALLQKNLDGYATIAAINSPQSVTISGDESAIDTVKRMADAEGLFARKLKVEVAYHSQHMEPAATPYLASITPFCAAESRPAGKDDSRPVFISSVTGLLESSETVDASYWVKNLLQPVRFADAIERLFSTGDGDTRSGQHGAWIPPNTILELGPHSALQNPIKQTVESIRQQSVQRQVPFTYLSSLVRGTSGDEAVLNLAGKLFCMGSSIELAAVNQTDHHNAHVLTDLPSYEWDRSVRYIHKSRIAHEKLHPGQSLSPLLGGKSVYGNGSEPTFRHVFTLDDMPWIRDHNVGGHVIFPMTGYLSLAIEALRRSCPSVPSSVLVREFHVKRSLDIEEGELVDITTKLRPAHTGTENISSTAWVFEINSWTETNGLAVHCHGQIEPKASDMTADSFTFRASAALIGSKDLTQGYPEREYSRLGVGGTLYGPAFRTMCGYWEGADCTVMETELRDLDLSPPSSFGSPISIDPPTLDTHLQGIGPFQGTTAYMPNYVSRVRISNKIPASAKQRFTIVTRLLGLDTKAGRLRSSVAAFAHCEGSLLPIAEWESVTYRSISSSDADDYAASLPASYYWDLIPSMDFVVDDDLAKMVSVDPNELELARQHRRKINSAGVHYMNCALKEIGEENCSTMTSHLARFFNWSKKVVARGELDLGGKPSSSLLAEVSTTDAQGEMLCAVGEQLVSILRGEVQPLEIMLKDNLLMRNYEAESAVTYLSRALAKFVHHLSDIKPDLRVLEIGAGTASATLPVLEELSRGAEKLHDDFSYTFTDTSTGFFENARSKLARWTQNITYKRLDIDQDPEQQGFSTEHYDVVIASNCLHATRNIAVTLDHSRKLLKPNGKLLLIEAVRHPPLSLPFALLPGWWLSEDEYRDHEEGPLLPEETWQRVLSARGFSGVDAAVADYPNTPEHIMSAICSTRIGLQEDSYCSESVTICGMMMDDEEEEFAQMVADHVSDDLNCPTSVKPFSEIDAEDDPFCIFIDSPRQTVSANFSPETFDAFKSTLLQRNGLLWVLPENCPPEAESIRGLLRTLRHETEAKNLLLLEKIPCTSDGALAVTHVTRRLRDLELARAAGIKDQDFFYRAGKLYLPRFRQLTGARDVFAAEAGTPVRKVQNIWQGDESLEMTVDTAGSPDSIYFRKNDVKKDALGDDEVLIRVEAVGINFRDLLLVLGSIPWTRPGFEGAGVVVQTGSGVTNLQPGDRVFYGALAGGAFSTYTRIPSWRGCRIPDDMSTVDAASISVAYCTAIFAIMRIGRLRSGETVLIHAASGAVGQACIVLAQHIGARIFATAGSAAKRQFLHETFGIPAENIFSSRTAEFRESILCATDGNGVDVIVNSLSGSLLQETWTLIGDFGRFVEIGKRDFLQNNYLGMRPFDRNDTFSGVDLRTLFIRRPGYEQECLSDLVDLVQRKVIVPIRPVTTLPISQLAVGLRKLQAGQNIGKIVVTMGSDDSVLSESLPSLEIESGQLLRGDATYLITGGTGGIGLSLASWMVKNGARNVVLLGRSGSSRPQVRELLDQYEGSAVQMRAIACDVGSRTELLSAIESTRDLPPIRGVVHGALYLRDSLLVNATYEDWRAITTPRVQGAWNIHELIQDLDFFVALSSFVGAAGNVGQGIYSGTATFFEAFARYRNSQGLPAVTIGLPVVLDVGYAADHGLTEALKVSLGATLTEADVHTAVKGAIIGPSSGLNRDGKAISFRFTSGDDPNTLGWQYYHPLALAERINVKQRSAEADSSGQGRDGRVRRPGDAWSGNPSGLLDALMDKVSSITMIERDEVEPDAPLSDYSLDSLVSVELRNWIRRETGVDLALPKIVGAANLRALATHMLSQREVRK